MKLRMHGKHLELPLTIILNRAKCNFLEILLPFLFLFRPWFNIFNNLFKNLRLQQKFSIHHIWVLLAFPLATKNNISSLYWLINSLTNIGVSSCQLPIDNAWWLSISFKLPKSRMKHAICCRQSNIGIEIYVIHKQIIGTNTRLTQINLASQDFGCRQICCCRRLRGYLLLVFYKMWNIYILENSLGLQWCRWRCNFVVDTYC